MDAGLDAHPRAGVPGFKPTTLRRGEPVAVWAGESARRVRLIDGGGLGDVLRTLPLLRAALAVGRVQEVAIEVRGARAELLARCGWRVVSPGEPFTHGELAAFQIHTLAGCYSSVYREWVGHRQPMTAQAAHWLGLPLAACAGPVLPLPRSALRGAHRQLLSAGWTGEPLVALQVEAPDPRLHMRRVKIPTGPCRSAAVHLQRAGCFPVLVGFHGPPVPGVADWRGASLVDTAALLHLADLVVAGDSGPLHLAAMLGTPVLGIYGNCDPAVHVSAAGTVVLTSSACPINCGLSSYTGSRELGFTDAGAGAGDNQVITRERAAAPCLGGPWDGVCVRSIPGRTVAAAAMDLLQHTPGEMPRLMSATVPLRGVDPAHLPARDLPLQAAQSAARRKRRLLKAAAAG